MQKKFVIIDNDVLLNDLIEKQVSIVFEKNFNIKFLKTYNINSLNVIDTIDLIIVNFKLCVDTSMPANILSIDPKFLNLLKY